MATVNEYLQQTHNIWDDLSFTSRQQIGVSEIWVGDSGKGLTQACEHFNIVGSQLESWLSQDVNGKGSQKPYEQFKRLRAIWIPRIVQQQTLDITEDIFNTVHLNFEHEVAYGNCNASVAAIGKVSATSSHVSAYFLSLQPKISLTWSLDERSGLLSMICIAEQAQIQTLKELLQQKFIQERANHILTPAAMFSLLLSMEVDISYLQVKRSLRQVEVRTGHHDWKSKKQPPALGDLAELSAKMSGYQMRLASAVRKQNVVSEVLNMMKSQEALESLKETSLMSTIVETLEEKAVTQQIDADYIQCRIRTQLDALYHLVAQRDALYGQEMAQDCKHLAIAAQRDSSSMKCIAAVTMFFLPGTFMSSLFSIPLFDWDAATTDRIFRPDYWKPRLYMFLATTLPLMCITFGAWVLYSIVERIRQRKRFTIMKTQLSTSLPENEARALVLKRSSLTEIF